eukprot:PRCOL_00006072-RA
MNALVESLRVPCGDARVLRDEARRLAVVAAGAATEHRGEGGGRDASASALDTVFELLVRNRLMDVDGWEHSLSASHRLHALQCVRLLLRGARAQSYCAAMASAGAVGRVGEQLAHLARDVLWAAQPRGIRSEPLAREMMHEYASVVKKLALVGGSECRRLLLSGGVHETLVALLRTNDGVLLPSALVALIALAANPSADGAGDGAGGDGAQAPGEAAEGNEDDHKTRTGAAVLVEVDCLAATLSLIRARGAAGVGPFEQLAAELLLHLCREPRAHEDFLQGGGTAIVVGALQAAVKTAEAVHTARAAADSDGSRAHGEGKSRDNARATAKAQTTNGQRPRSRGRRFSMSDVEAINSLLATLLRLIDALAAEARCATSLVKAGAVRVLASMLSTAASRRAALPDALTRRTCCSALARLSVDDEGALSIGRENGVYSLASLLLEHARDGAVGTPSDEDSVAPHVFRALRFVFGSGRNRPAFKRLFPPELFAAFIDVGHYQWALGAYVVLARMLAALTAQQLAGVASGIQELAGQGDHGDADEGGGRDSTAEGGGGKTGRGRDVQGRGSRGARVVRGYEIHEVIGTGAFGAVHRARRFAGGAAATAATADADGGKRARSQWAALKVLPMDSTTHFGATAPEREASSRGMLSEVAILSELDHPNIVAFYDSFVEEQELFIAMELVDGASLADWLTSLKEKGQTLEEDAVWDILLQLMGALHYLHAERRIVHRDLSTANVLVEARSRQVKLTDFGLARVRRKQNDREFSVMQSVVGTMAYSCPEIIQHMPYTDKADVWSLGCILYQLMALRPPFECTNPLALAMRIVEMEYDPPPERFSPELRQVVKSLLTADPDQPPNIAGISALPGVAERLMQRLSAAEREAVRLRNALEQESGARRRQSHITAAAEARRRLSLTRSGAHVARNNNSASGGVPTSGDGARSSSTARRTLPPLDHASGPDASTGGGMSSSSGEHPRRPAERGRLDGGRLDGMLQPRRMLGASAPIRWGRRSLELSTRAGGGFGPAAMVTIQRRKLRPLADPTAQLLATMHKLLHVQQLPPLPGKQPRRRLVERFVAHLSRPETSAGQLKAELANLAARSRDALDIVGAGEGDHTTYEELAAAVEAELRRAAFYTNR